jgi:pilus assembly protein Flp/PilA
MNTKILAKLRAFLRREEGLTTVEYAIAGGLVGAAVIVAFTNLGTQVGRIINLIVTALTAVNP